MIPKTTFTPMRLTMMKKVKSKKIALNAASSKFVGKLAVYIHSHMYSEFQCSAPKLTDPSVFNRPYSNTLMKH